MTARTKTLLRGVILVTWLVLALLVVGPALAQGGDGDSPFTRQAPEDLDDIAVVLTPLLVGAALIERTIEVVFTWIERALIDVGHWLNRTADALAGLVAVDLRNAWSDLSELTNAMLQRSMTDKAQAFEGNPDSNNPHDWPLAMLEDRLQEAKARVATAQSVVAKALKSPEYVARKKTLAAILSMGFGLLLAVAGDLRLFQPLGVEAANWFTRAFDVFDLLMAGILMGLGTEWVHQVIGILTKGKDALGRVGIGTPETTTSSTPVDLEQLRMLAESAVTEELKNQLGRVTSDMRNEFVNLASDGDQPNPPE